MKNRPLILPPILGTGVEDTHDGLATQVFDDPLYSTLQTWAHLSRG
jgi:hypothetical protein